MAHSVWNTSELEKMTQHEKVNFFITSSYADYFIPPSLDEKLQRPHRLTFYFFVYRIEGGARHVVDFADVSVKPGQLLFLLPHQIHLFPPKDLSGRWYKMAFSDATLAQLPATYAFLQDPLGDQLIDVDGGAGSRIAGCFGALEQVVHHTEEKNPALIQSYLHSLLTELDILYFKKPAAAISASSAFTRFRLLVNERLRAHPTIASLAVELNLSESRLYSLVKSTTGLSPKEYLLNRLILEARRCLFYKEHSPKELSWELGFNDPNHFFRVFKKYSGRSVTQFLEELKGMHR